MIIWPELREYQVDVTNRTRKAAAACKRPVRVILQASTGCHAEGQGILMYDGTIKVVEDVAFGDLVMGPDSNPRQVVSLCRGHDQMFRIAPVKGNPFVVNGDHVLTLCKTKIKERTSATAPRSDCKTHVGGELVDVTVNEWMKWPAHKKHVWKLVRTGVEFKSSGERLLLDPYFLGVMLGDGSMIRNVSVTTADPEIATVFKEQAARYGLSVRMDLKPNNKAASYIMSRKRHNNRLNPVQVMLREIGVWGLSCDDKFVPFVYKTSSKSNRLQILAGLLDTDGSLAHGGFDFISKSQQLADDVAFIARSVGLAAYINSCEKRDQNGQGGTYYRVSISGDCAIIPCRLPRKQASKRLQKKSILRTGFTVSPCGLGDYYGFTLAGASNDSLFCDGRYLLDDFTITHNSGKSVMGLDLILRCYEKGKRALFIVSGRALVNQFERHLQMSGVPHGVIMAGRGQNLDAPVQIASKETLAARLIRREAMQLPLADLIVVDEAHEATANEFVQLLDRYSQSVVIGLTATPALGNGKGLGHVWNGMEKAISTQALVEQGFLVPCRVFAPYTPDLKGVKLDANGDYDRKQVARRMDRPKLVGDLLQNWRKYADGRRTVIFGCTIAHAKHICDEFNTAGIKFRHIDEKTNDDEREEIFGLIKDGKCMGFTNVSVARRGLDLPCLEAACVVRPTRSLVLWLQMIGRIRRPCKETGKQNCIAEGQLVLTDRGLVPIEKVACNDRVWDGVSFVRHDGVVYKGVQDVITYAGITATPDHQVWTRDGWRSLVSCQRLRLDISKTGDFGREIRIGRSFVGGSSGKELEVPQKGVCVCAMCAMRLRGMGSVRQSEAWANERMSAMQSTEKIHEEIVATASSSTSTVHEPKQFGMGTIRETRDKVLLPFRIGGLLVGAGEPWRSRRVGIGQDRQQRKLRTWEHTPFNTTAEYGTYQKETSFGNGSQVQGNVPACPVCGCDVISDVLQGNDAGADNHQMGNAIVQTKRKVWDILNAGPFHRFTVQGLLVHNCVIIDHAGACDYHCMPDFEIDWKLDSEKTVNDWLENEKKEGKVPKQTMCPKCYCMFTGSARCPNCGHTVEQQRHTKPIDHADGVLVERTQQAVASLEDMQRWWNRCIGVAANRSQKMSACVNMFKQKYKRLPWAVPGMKNVPAPGPLWQSRADHLFPSFKKVKLS